MKSWRCATQAKRPASANSLLPDDHASPMPMDYFIWAIRNCRTPCGWTCRRLTRRAE